MEIQDNVYRVKEWLKDYQYVGDNFSSMDSIKLIVNDEDFQKIYGQQGQVYDSVASMLALETDLYFSGTDEEKYEAGHRI